MPKAKDDSPRTAHPIHELCLQALVKGKGEPFDLSADGAKKLKSQLALHFDQPDLVPAVEELVVVAWFLSEKKACPKAADKLLKIAETAIPALEQRGVDAKAVLSGDSLDKTKRAAAAELLAKPLRQAADPRMEKPAGGPGGALGLFARKDKK